MTQPATPTRAETRVRGSLPRFEVAEWRERYGVVAGITARGADFTLSPETPGDPVAVRWRRLLETFAPGFHGVVVGRQVHGTTVLTHQGATPGVRFAREADGHATAASGLLLAVTVADCVPVYLLDPARGALALLHAGWRGVATGILRSGIAALHELSGSAVHAIVMHCGIAICGDCYEVGPEVLEAVRGTRSAGPGRLDLRGALAAEAGSLGVQDVSVSPGCTAHDPGRFYSHRGSRGATGRMAAYLGRPVA